MAGRSGRGAGGTLFAAVMMVLVGIFQALAGLAALMDQSIYSMDAKNLFQMDAAGWGWTHLILGALVALAGLAVFAGATWGRMVGIFVVVISAVSNFLFIPHYPIWALTLIAIDVWVIWSLTVWSPEDIY